MKTVAKILLAVFLIGMTGFSVTAQTQQDFDQWQREQRTAFQRFIDEQDQAFADFLRQQWEEMQLLQGVVPDDSPKPIEQPVFVPPPDTLLNIPTAEALPDHLKPRERPIVLRQITLPPTVPTKIDTVPPPPPLKLDLGPDRKTIRFSFFGNPLVIALEPSTAYNFGPEIKEETIARYWEAMSGTDFKDGLKQVQYYKEKLQLNDWGYCLLLNELAKSLYPTNLNQRHLWIWFMLVKSGYTAKIGYNGNQISLLLPTENTLYGIPYLTLDESRFYLVSLDPDVKSPQTSVYTYKGEYPGADKGVSLQMMRLPNLGTQVESKTLKFDFAGQTYSLTAVYDKKLIEFFADYPQTNLEVYFGVNLSLPAETSLLNSLRPVVVKKSEQEAANFLLRFVQIAFDYKTDPEQFGREKYLFPEETLFYPYSDCEDRSILFAYLVTNLLGLEVIGLDYPGHIATAVRFTQEVPGDAVIYRNNRYVICDPTYLNAEAGRCIPLFKGVQPVIIGLR